MADLTFRVDDVVAEPYAAAPQLTARLQVSETSGQRVHAIALRCQVRIEPQRRGYGGTEVAGLTDQFGSRDRWAQTLRPFLWLQTGTMVQGFDDTVLVDLPMPVSYDFEVTASKYLHALTAGTVPLAFLFSGTVFTRGTAGFGVEQVAWNTDTSYPMPMSVWRECMSTHFPGTGWLRLQHESLTALQSYKADHGLTTFDAVVDHLLSGVSARAGDAP